MSLVVVAVAVVVVVAVGTGGTGIPALAAGYAAASSTAAAAAVAKTAAVVIGAAALVLFASSNRPRSNTKQNDQCDAVMKELGVTKHSSMWRRIHDAISGKYDLGYKQVYEFAKKFIETH